MRRIRPLEAKGLTMSQRWQRRWISGGALSETVHRTERICAMEKGLPNGSSPLRRHDHPEWGRPAGCEAMKLSGKDAKPVSRALQTNMGTGEEAKASPFVLRRELSRPVPMKAKRCTSVAALSAGMPTDIGASVNANAIRSVRSKPVQSKQRLFCSTLDQRIASLRKNASTSRVAEMS